jgi:hypothetical protein
MQMLVGQIIVFADLHRHAAARARIAVTRNDPDEITLSLFFFLTANPLLNEAP